MCPKYIQSFVSISKIIITLIKVAVPILLIVFGSIDMFKAVTQQNEDEIKKATKKFIERLIAAAIVFFVFPIIMFIANVVAPNSKYVTDFTYCYEHETAWNTDGTGDTVIEKPSTPTLSGSCYFNINLDGTTTVYVNDKDANYYDYINEHETISDSNNEYTFNGTYYDINVVSYDNNSTNKMICYEKNIETYPVINPLSSINIVAQAKSESLIVKVQKIDSYYLTYLWVEDPYRQINKSQATTYGTDSQLPIDILKNEINNSDLKDKIVVATNASGFYSIGEWDPNTASYNKQYNYTQEGGLVITSGKVIRNWYYDAAVDKDRNDSIYGIDPTGRLLSFPRINSYSEEERKELFQSIIDTRIRNTITFRPQLIENGKTIAWKNGTGKSNITALCQINRNNFIILSARSAIIIGDAINLFENLGCQTAVNFDGGGSVTLLFKDANKEIETIAGGTRSNIEIFYFTER